MGVEEQGRGGGEGGMWQCAHSGTLACLLARALQTVFVAVKGSSSRDYEHFDEDAMMRFEFYEGIARAAHGKFIETK